MSKECIHFLGHSVYITSNKAVLDKYIHFVLVYFEPNGDDETYDYKSGVLNLQCAEQVSSES